MIHAPSSRPPSHLAIALLAAVLILTAATAHGQQPTGDPRTFSDTAQVTAVELVVTVEDSAGQVPANLRPEDFEVREDGEPMPVVGVEVWSRGTVARSVQGKPELRVEEQPLWTWSSVIYFDQVLSSSRSIRRAAEALAGQAATLTGLGTVEIVTANPGLEVVLAATRSPVLLEQTLRQLARRTVGRDALRMLRKQMVQDQETVIGLDHIQAGIATSEVTDLRQSTIAGYVMQESLLLRRQHEVLMSWLDQHQADGPRALFLVNDGYDLRPADFYSRLYRGDVSAFLAADMEQQQAAPDVRELSQTLAASGWVTMNMALGALDAATATGADQAAQGRMGNISLRDTVAQGIDSLFLRPLDPLRQMSTATGGETLTGTGRLPLAIDKLRDKVRLTYQVARLPDGELHEVEVRALRPGLRVEGPRWSGSAAPEGTAAARARRLLAGGGERGDVPLVAAVALEPTTGVGDEPKTRRGKLQARVDLGPLKSSLARSRPTPVRVTLAASFPDGPPFIRHDLVEAQALADLDAWTYATRLSMPAAVERVAVVFEDLFSGSWGGALAAVVEGDLPDAVRAVGVSDHDIATSVEGYIPQDLLPERKPILLLPPAGGGVVRGRTQIEPIVASPRIARVEYRLDGRPVADSERAPFAAKIGFGELPEARTLEVVAFDAEGYEMGRDSLIVNEGAGTFRVRIIEPRSGDRVGPVDVEAEVRIPRGPYPLEQVEMFWNGRRVATLFEPPFRQRILIPPQAPVGYISVIATRRDGSTAEDVVFMNGTGDADRVDVKLVELFTVVNDPQSRPVRGLERDDFSIFEDGDAQQLADFRPGAEMPLALGLLMDTSASMTPAMRQAQSAAIDFLMLTLGDQDRAAVIGFNDRPRLVQELTGDRQELVRAIASLRPGGTSALCDALVFSLVEMQRVPGRRALVVLTDGVGREERVDFSTCMRFVQRSAIPLYAILLAGDDPTAADHGGIDSEKLGRLVEAVGGRLYVARAAEQLGRVYRQVIDELESQYLLTYYPTERRDEGWRDVDVEVDEPGLVARTVGGYYP